MIKLYFMNREFEGVIFSLEEAIESRDIRLLFEDSWYWLHYRFMNCRDSICSEKSSVIRTQLYNLAAMLYKDYEALSDDIIHSYHKPVINIIDEVVDIAEYSRDFPICLWARGDKNTKEALGERCKKLPPDNQIEELMNLPHFKRLEMERLTCSYDADKEAIQRYRNELGAYNKRKKLSIKNRQRSQNKGVDTTPGS